MRAAVAAIVAAFAAAMCATIPAYAFTGRVVGIADGDTLTVMHEQRPVRVRLFGIDAPEHGQPFASRARESLSELAHGRDADVDERGRDTYGRVLGRVRVAGVDVNAEQVRRGYAWVFRRYTRDPVLLALEDDARAARRGLWRDAAPVAPWTWRVDHPNIARPGVPDAAIAR